MTEEFNLDADCELGEDEYYAFLEAQELVNYEMELFYNFEVPYEELIKNQKDFIGRLYSGFAAEYHLIAELFRLGLEGVKLPGDFGFDVMSTNQRSRVYEGELTKTVRFFQVKSIWVSDKNYKYEGNNKKLKRKLLISPKDMIKIIKEDDAYLSLYCLNKETGEIVGSIWLSNYHLNQLLGDGFVKLEKIKDKTLFSIDIEFIFIGNKKNEIISEIEKMSTMSEAEIKKELPNLLKQMKKIDGYDEKVIRIYKDFSNFIELNIIHSDISNINEMNKKSKISDDIKILPDAVEFTYPFDWNELLK